MSKRYCRMLMPDREQLESNIKISWKQNPRFFIMKGENYVMPKQIKCPICNKRLLDIQKESSGEIAIKCTHCKQIAYIKLERYS